MPAYEEFEKELDELTATAKRALVAILLSDDRISKHAPYTWAKDDVNDHILKAIGHIAYGMGQYHGYKKPDGEDHLHNAITRLVMAKSIIDRERAKVLQPTEPESR